MIDARDKDITLCIYDPFGEMLLRVAFTGTMRLKPHLHSSIHAQFRTRLVYTTPGSDLAPSVVLAEESKVKDSSIAIDK